jgi:phage baseplate assembly protein W
MQDNSKGLWGRGWAFPPRFSLAHQDQPAGPVLVEDLEDIRQSLKILFHTLPGERIMRADYGCDLHAVLFENMSEDLLAEIRRIIRDGMLRHEPRVELIDLVALQNDIHHTQLDVSVSYRVRGSDARGEVRGFMELSSGEGVRFQ